MSEKSNVYFKATKGHIIVMLNNETDFSLIKEDLRDKVSKASKFFGDSKSSILFNGRSLSESEESELVEIITNETNLNITSVLKDRYIKKVVGETSVKAENISYAKKEINPITRWDRNNAFFHKGSVRSGVQINHKGSIIIIGDVNPGGKVVAEGNVVVLGALRGNVHAGSSGNKDCFVSALNLVPTQLRIANIITSLAEEIENKKTKNKNTNLNAVPSYAFVQDDQIYIAPLV